MATPKRLRTIDPATSASDPGAIRLSSARLRRVRPDLFGAGALWHALLVFMSVEPFPHRRMIREQLEHGDSRAAVVMGVRPLRIAAYTDELDCVAMLRFDDALAAEFGLSVGSRLLTINTYRRDGGGYDADLSPGPRRLERWFSFSPMIADFLTDDVGRVAARKAQINEAEWARTIELGKAYLRDRPGQFRDGRPVLAAKPARRAAAAGS